MREWTRGDKIATWSLAVAIVSCPVLYQLPIVRNIFDRSGPSNPPVLNLLDVDKPQDQQDQLTVAQQNIIEAHRKKAEEETKAAREEALRLHEERIEIRSRRIEAIAKELYSGDNPSFDRISLKNDCAKTAIYVALSYQDLAEGWVTRGWWEVKPSEIVQTDAMTRNRSIYFFAKSANPELPLFWNGEREEGALHLSVAEGKFDQMNEEPFSYENFSEVAFFMRDTGDDWTNYEQGFSCE